MTSLDVYLDGLKDRHSPPDSLHAEVMDILRQERDWESYIPVIERRYLFAHQEQVYKQELGELVKNICETDGQSLRVTYLETLAVRTEAIMGAMKAKLEGDIIEDCEDETIHQLIKASSKQTSATVNSLVAQYEKMHAQLMGNRVLPDYLN